MLKFLRDARGAASAEYALILAIVGSGLSAAALDLGGSVAGAMNRAGNEIAEASQGDAGAGGGPPADPGNGQGGGPPADPGNGQGGGPPADPGNGQGGGPPADPGQGGAPPSTPPGQDKPKKN